MDAVNDPILQRIADALERIADSLEGGHTVPIEVKAPVEVRLDGHTVHQEVVRYTLRRSARGPSSLVGGTLMTGGEGRG